MTPVYLFSADCGILTYALIVYRTTLDCDYYRVQTPKPCKFPYFCYTSLC